MTEDVFTRIAQRVLGESTTSFARPVIAPLYAPGAALPTLADARLSVATERATETGPADEHLTHDAETLAAPALRPRVIEVPTVGPPILTMSHDVEPDLHPHASGWPLDGRLAREAGVAAAEPPSRDANTGQPVVASRPQAEHDTSASLQSAIVSPVEMVRPNITPLAAEPPQIEPATSPVRSDYAVPVDVRLRHAHPRADVASDVRLPAMAQHHAEPAAYPPQVRVTIGRVEVRAITAHQPASTAPQRSAPPAPQLSLDDYLRARNEGRR
jgi:hypothetical protein